MRVTKRYIRNCQYLHQPQVSQTKRDLGVQARSWEYTRSRRPPLPEIIRSRDTIFRSMDPREWNGRFSSLRGRRWSMVQRYFQKHNLYRYHNKRLNEQRSIEFCARVIKHSANQISHLLLFLRFSDPRMGGSSAYLNIEATSIIKGISSENPALDFERCIA